MSGAGRGRGRGRGSQKQRELREPEKYVVEKIHQEMGEYLTCTK